MARSEVERFSALTLQGQQPEPTAPSPSFPAPKLSPTHTRPRKHVSTRQYSRIHNTRTLSRAASEKACCSACGSRPRDHVNVADDKAFA